ncbi:MAG: hypothetical protein DKM50_10265 [Candidatus Margulisiibacteriota bacterium]|nr:MAG: hypothetical protein A2X43_06350 [Candidatus Margulisbacteria bacterium GWD2_39_127]OGI05229.1 MAG: hypothetical protein A2X42_02860 [Candidatus Margulisbacteria bacterium GWF2_38_17]OGI06278.1 MAG: hypothetical protein A2X41_08440 [Candidatus Margulisbacteria bacterium GWE2_39_32]PZM78935.1 MAG: hypothetical protein DKM50_10265 [Candidatus Margulisiibacteriota bacterium]HAR64317.1 hypothetical protein [Candidatus Margulisiibacteriota bacterium]
MFGKIFSASLQGLEAHIVEVEIDVKHGLPGHNIVGLPDAAVKESKNRVEAAITNSGYVFPLNKYFTINLAPAYLRKEGPMYDLPMAFGILAVTGQISKKYLEDSIVLGELSLEGRIKPIQGVLSMCLYAKEKGFRRVFLPEKNVEEGALVQGIDIIPLNNLAQAAAILGDYEPMEKYQIDFEKLFEEAVTDTVDFSEVKGQEFVKRGIEIAAAGGHNLLMIGSPGCGKTMIAKRIPTVLPPMTMEEALEITKIYSIIGQLPMHKSLITARPFRSPHHTVSNIALVGGSSVPRPGAVSLAHNGVLFLDELAEFKREALEVLRQPLEDGVVTISRAKSTLTYPAQFMFVAAVNPCPCGYAFDQTIECTCSPANRDRYWQKLSGPLLDRIDIQIEVRRLNEDELMQKKTGESSVDIRKRVERARAIQQKRLHGEPIHCNAQMAPKHIKESCSLDDSCAQLMRNAIRSLSLSARSFDKIIKVARTIADLAGEASIKSVHLAEAIQYRGLDRKF